MIAREYSKFKMIMIIIIIQRMNQISALTYQQDFEMTLKK